MEKNTWIGLVIAALCLAFVFLNQTPKNKATPDDLLQSTMDIHDAAMRDLAEMNRIGRQFKKTVTELDSLAPRADSIRTLLRQMKQAETDMYTWMREYKAPSEPLDEAGKMYLEGQKSKISKNYSDIQAALNAGLQLSGQ
jgi:hypothetical protein